MLREPDGDPHTSARPFLLLVDDEKEFVDTLSKRLSARDYQVAVAYDFEYLHKPADISKLIDALDRAYAQLNESRSAP